MVGTVRGEVGCSGGIASEISCASEEFDGGLLRGLLDAFQDPLQLPASGIQVTGHGIQRNLRLVGTLCRIFRPRQQPFQRRYLLRGGVLIGVGRSHDPSDLGFQCTLPVGELAVEALHFGMSAAQPAALCLHLTGQLLQLRPQLNHRRSDRGLCLGPRLAARRIKACVRGGTFRLRLDQILGEVGDLLVAGGGMHPLAHGVFAAVGRDTLLTLVHLPAQVASLLLQKLGGGLDEAVLRGVLILDINIHRVVHCGRRL